MDRLRDACILLFARYDAGSLLQRALEPFEVPGRGEEEERRRFLALGMGEPGMRWYGHAAMDALAQRVGEGWSRPHAGGGGEEDWEREGAQSPFHVLARAAEPLILNFDFEPRIKHQHMLRWRKLSFEVTADLVICAHLAWSDRGHGVKNRDFGWDFQPKTDNRRLQGMLARGVAENHAHLIATAPIFEASWLALMLDPLTHRKTLQDIGKQSLDAEKRHDGSAPMSLFAKVAFAAGIRVWLWRAIQKIEDKPDLAPLLRDWRNGLQSLPSFSAVQREIDVYKMTATGLDYIPRELNSKGSELVAGERRLLYLALMEVYRGKHSACFEHLLHAYLLLKNQIRREWVQTNDRKGFGNFLIYQDRKDEVFKRHPKIKDAAIVEALKVDCASGLGGSLEYRIAPKKTSKELEDTIRGYARALAKREDRSRAQPFADPDGEEALRGLLRRNIFFTVHFIKEEEKAPSACPVGCKPLPLRRVRHADLREKVMRQALDLMKLRASGEVWSKLIRGIDAASSEFYTRPEVYAVAFRLLRRYAYSINTLPLAGGSDVDRLRVTFHAGEDFYCLTDGMRYVEEAVRLLEYQDGDRLGHALALGIDPHAYFAMKRWEILLPQQELLDNLVWILWMARIHNIQLSSALESQIRERIHRLLSQLYPPRCPGGGRGAMEAAVQDYEYAYLLRGDDPQVYFDYPPDRAAAGDCSAAPDRKPFRPFYPEGEYPDLWRGGDPKYGAGLGAWRGRGEVRDLVCRYHQDPVARAYGVQMTSFQVPRELPGVLRDIQNALLAVLQKHHIAIECNPSSNVLIGPIEHYIEHPILRFYNRELTLPGSGPDPGPDSGPDSGPGLPASHQLLASINTDDAGIFGTSLETEYALLARALEKKKGRDGKPVHKPHDVYAWLNSIRLMGLDLSFRDRGPGPSDEP